MKTKDVLNLFANMPDRIILDSEAEVEAVIFNRPPLNALVFIFVESSMGIGVLFDEVIHDKNGEWITFLSDGTRVLEVF